MTRKLSTQFAGFAGFILLSLAAGSIGAVFLPGDWYAALAKPSWNPPNWVFAPVWTCLYILMGIAAGLVWQRAGRRAARGALGLFLVQLLLNSAWSWLFFGLHQPALAFAELVILWIAIAATALAFWRWRPLAGWLLAPYLAWVSFAGALNFALWQLN